MLDNLSTPPNDNIISNDQENLVNVLNDLVEINKESSDGFTLAAELTEEERYHDIFREMAAQRQRFATELMNLIVKFDGEPETNPSLNSLFQRVWMGIKNAVQGDEAALMEMCEESEATLIKAYQTALDEEELPENVTQKLKEQLSHIRLAQEKLEDLATLLA